MINSNPRVVFDGEDPAGPDVVIATGGSNLTTQVYAGAALDGAIGAGELAPPQRIRLTFPPHADWNATVATLDENGDPQTEYLNIPDGGGAIVTSPAFRFRTFTRWR